MTNQKRSPMPTKNFGINLKDFIRKNSKSIILAFVIILFNTFALLVAIQHNGYPIINMRTILIFALYFILNGLVFLGLYLAKTKAWGIEKLYLFLGLTLGLFYSIVIPVGGIPDEAPHFWRAYELSELRLFAETDSSGNKGIYVPSNLHHIIDTEYANPSHDYAFQLNNFFIKATDEYSIYNAAADSYSPFNYVPQTLGIWIGKILQLPLMSMMYLSRILNMAFCVTIIFFCIKHIPILKRTVFLIAMFPMTMQLFSSTSADGSIICAGIALISFFIYFYKTKNRQINTKNLILLFFICATLVITKPVYAFLCLILFFLPKSCFKSTTHKYCSILLIGAAILGLTILRLILATSEARYDSSMQINFITQSPFSFFLILFKNIFLQPEQYIASSIGKELEWFWVDLFSPCVITFFLFFAFLCAEQESTIKRTLKDFCLAIFLIIAISIFAVMFIQWTSPGETVIDGVQGRYFLPMVLLIPIICMPSQKPKHLQLVKSNYLYIFTALTNVYAIAMIFCTHI